MITIFDRVRWELFRGKLPHRMREVCAGPLGAVKALERPAWFTADPRIIACEGLTPSTDNGGPKTATAKPSLRPYPSDADSKVRHRPTGDRA